jgi:pyruvate dehydrogenase E1 component
MSDFSRFDDLDPTETREWLESIDSVLETQGPERAHFLLNQMIDFARRSGAYLPYAPNTAYLNTIATGRQPEYPGDRSVERRIEAYIRWNAMAMVVQANRQSSEYGGHISSYASSATMYEVGFNHFWRAPTTSHGGDLVFIQGHSSPGIYSRAYLEGRLTEDQLNRFRQEVGGGGLSSYPHPWLMPDFWQFPTVSMGLGPMMAIYQARFMRYLDARRSRQPDLRRQLQPATARWPGARQRQDHPGTRSGIPRRGLERDQGHLGLALGSPACRRPQRASSPCYGRVCRRGIPEFQIEGR